MGTDIHSIVQVKINNLWKTVGARVGGDGRDYDTFAVLADVRNGYGFAGCITGEGWPVMFEARGLPKDLKMNDDRTTPLTKPYYYNFDKEKKDPVYNLWLGDHSFSYLTLNELLQIHGQFLDKTYTKVGYITREQFDDLQKGVLPTTWCGGTNNPNYIQASWASSAIDELWGLKNIIKSVGELAEKYNAGVDDVRFVFGFDS